MLLYALQISCLQGAIFASVLPHISTDNISRTNVRAEFHNSEKTAEFGTDTMQPLSSAVPIRSVTFIHAVHNSSNTMAIRTKSYTHRRYLEGGGEQVPLKYFYTYEGVLISP